MVKAENKSNRFLRAPGLGGITAIVYCLLWPTLLVLSRQTKSGSAQETVFQWLIIVLSFPLALRSVLYASLHNEPNWVVFWVLIGLNSFIWGYSIEMLVRVIRRKRHQ